jgi:hypothetical protein
MYAQHNRQMVVCGLPLPLSGASSGINTVFAADKQYCLLNIMARLVQRCLSKNPPTSEAARRTFVDLKCFISEYASCESGINESKLPHADNSRTYPDIRDLVNAAMFEIGQLKMSVMEFEPRPELIEKPLTLAHSQYTNRTAKYLNFRRSQWLYLDHL